MNRYDSALILFTYHTQEVNVIVPIKKSLCFIIMNAFLGLFGSKKYVLTALFWFILRVAIIYSFIVRIQAEVCSSFIAYNPQ